jgi:predicted acylesterase/phospholipase RssA
MKKIDFREAVVLSGGGAKGAYEVGVMKTLFNGKSKSTAGEKINPGTFTGTSVGSFNAAVMVSHSEEHSSKAVEHLEEIWLNEIADRSENRGNGVFRFRGVPSGVFNPAFMTKHPLLPVGELIEDSASLSGDWFKRVLDFSVSDESFSRKVMEFVNISSMISLDPYHRLLKKHLHVEEIQESKRALRIAATKWKTG